MNPKSVTRLTADDGVELYVEETGTGSPVLFIHEFAGDHRSWEPQVRKLATRYRCITYNARGYPPSDVPNNPDAYSMDRAVNDAVCVLDSLGIGSAHVVGLSMGGFTSLFMAMRHPERILSAVVAACGYGAELEHEEAFRAECAVIAKSFATRGSEEVAKRYSIGPARVQFQNKNPRGWEEFASQLAEHSAEGAALTMSGVQAKRPSLYRVMEDLRAIDVPVLVITGDEDERCLEPSVMLKRTIPTAGLSIMSKTGHTCNLEEPELFNQLVSEFIVAVEAKAWGPRDPRSLATTTTGIGSNGEK